MAEQTTAQPTFEDWYGIKPVWLVAAGTDGAPVALKTSNGYLQLAAADVEPRDVVGLGGPIAVSTLTPLIAFTDFGTDYSRLLFYVTNPGAVDATVTLETSEDGTIPDGVATQTKACAAGEQVSFELGPDLLRRYWRISGQTASSSTTLRAGVRGTPRGGA